MRRIWALILAVTMALSGCGRASSGSETDMGAGKEKLRVVTTLFPYYDFVRQIAGDRVELSMVIPAGMDSHSFEPTPADMITIQNADVVICNGGVMEHWLDQVLNAADSTDRRVAVMMDYVDAVQEEVLEGMEESHDHAHGHDEHGESEEYDEHIWTSPVNAMKIVGAIEETLAEADPANREYYQSRADAYREELEELHRELLDVAAHAKRNTIIVGDKFPFRYLADEYGFEYRAAFSGCSTDTEPSARTIAYLIEQVRREGLPAVYYLELSSHRVSEVIAEETGALPLLLHSCHNVTRSEFDGGITYLELMERNVENLRRGLDE